MHAVGGGGQIGRKKERKIREIKKERKELTITTWAKVETERKRQRQRERKGWTRARHG
jgi:hypothetical protein